MHDVRIEYDMPAAEYHAIPAVSKSLLGKFDRTMAHGKYEMDNPSDSDALRFGRAFHVLTLEPQNFDAECAVAPKCDRRTKEGKNAWADFEAISKGKHILKDEEYALAQEMAKNVQARDEYHQLIHGGGKVRYEVSYFWQDEDTWEKCKTRTDIEVIEHPDFGIIIGDLKSVRDADERKFTRDAEDYDYHMGAAMHIDAFEAAHKITPDYYVFPVAEKTMPCLANSYFVKPDSDFVREGRRIFKERIRAFSAAKVKNTWEGYPRGFTELDLTSWTKRKLENGEV